MVTQKKNKAAFLDRDGVINKDLHFVSQWKDFSLFNGVIEGLTILQSIGYLLIIVTNQSGIDRGIFSEHDYNLLTNRYLELLSRNGVKITEVYYCPHHPLYSQTPYDKCFCRKPKPGMILSAANKYNIDLNESILIGDRMSDLEAAQNAGIEKRFLIVDNKNKYDYNDILISKSFSSLLECSRYIDTCS